DVRARERRRETNAVALEADEANADGSTSPQPAILGAISEERQHRAWLPAAKRLERSKHDIPSLFERQPAHSQDEGPLGAVQQLPPARFASPPRVEHLDVDAEGHVDDISGSRAPEPRCLIFAGDEGRVERRDEETRRGPERARDAVRGTRADRSSEGRK